MQNLCRAIPALLALPFLMGCASTGVQPVGYSGFLTSYDELSEDDDAADLVYERPGLDLSAYNAIMVEPVQVVIDPERKGKGFDPDDGAALAAYFENALIDAVKDKYAFATQPGPAVLSLRAAITEMLPGKPARNLLTTVSPGGLVLSTLSRAATGAHLYVGRATVEAEVVDSTTEQRFIALVDREAGAKHQVGQGAKEWGHVKAMFDAWALDFRKRLDDASMPAHTE